MKLILSSLRRNVLKPIIVFVVLTGALLALSKAQPGKAKPKFLSAFAASSPGPNVSVPTPNYTVTSSTGASIVPGTTDVGNHCDDCITGITLPFPVILYDQVFTSAGVSSNGNLQLGSGNGAYTNAC